MIRLLFFFFNDTATTEIYTLSLHDALPICCGGRAPGLAAKGVREGRVRQEAQARRPPRSSGHARLLLRARPHSRAGPDRIPNLRSEEHTSELQSRQYLVCRLLLEKKNTHC